MNGFADCQWSISATQFLSHAFASMLKEVGSKLETVGKVGKGKVCLVSNDVSRGAPRAG